jgi:hypothetical protein
MQQKQWFGQLVLPLLLMCLLAPPLLQAHVHMAAGMPRGATELNSYFILSGEQMVLPLLHMWAIGLLHCVIVATMSTRNTPQPVTEGTHAAPL